MTIGDGLACLSIAVAAVGFAWAVAWSMVRMELIRAEARRRLGDVKATTTGRGKA